MATVIERVRSHRHSLPAVLAAATLVAAAGMFLAVLVRPYGWDEAAHTGYVMSLRDGVLPDIDTEIPGEGRSRELEVAATRSSDFFNPDVHVANNPPHLYALAIPAAELTLRAGLRAGPLLGVRALDVAGGTVAVVLTYLLAWELVRRRLTAATAAALQATVVAVPIITARAALDGPALAATTATCWALVRTLRRGRPSDAALLGVTCAIGAAIRPMTLAFVVVAGAIGLAALWRRHGTGRLPGLMLRVAGPTALVAGWFYVINVVRYGDPTGSRALLDKFGMRGSGTTFWGWLLSDRSLTRPLGHLLADVYGEAAFFQPTDAARLVGPVAVGVLVAATVASARRAPWRPLVARGHDLAGAGPWAALLALACVPPVLLTQHAVEGGGPHPRYLLPLLPIVCSAAALLLTAIHRLLPPVAVAVLGVVLLRRLDDVADGVTAQIARRPGDPLATRIIGGPVPPALLLVAGAALAALVVALAIAARDDRAPDTGPPAPG